MELNAHVTLCAHVISSNFIKCKTGLFIFLIISIRNEVLFRCDTVETAFEIVRPVLLSIWIWKN